MSFGKFKKLKLNSSAMKHMSGIMKPLSKEQEEKLKQQKDKIKELNAEMAKSLLAPKQVNKEIKKFKNGTIAISKEQLEQFKQRFNKK